MSTVPVLEIGGTHVTSAAVELPDGVADTARTGARPFASIPQRQTCSPIDPDEAADALIGRFAAVSVRHDIPSGLAWGVAIPDPFDYVHGIGLFEGVGKFAALNGVDLRAGLLGGIPRTPASVTFVNDADAFALGEWTDGCARGAPRCVGITLGTGVGSGWLVDGRPVDPGTPPGGRIHRLTIAGRPLEDVVSRRALRRAFVRAGGDDLADVVDICELARTGHAVATRVLDEAFRALGGAVAPVVTTFGADVLVVGGSMSASWDVLGPSFIAGAAPAGLPPVRVSVDPQHSGLVGAAVAVRQLPAAIPVDSQA